MSLDEYVLPNGINLSIAHKDSNEVAISVVFPYGLIDNPTISHLLEHLLRRSNGKFRAEGMANIIERGGGSYDLTAYIDRTQVNIKVPVEYTKGALEWIYLSIGNHEFDAEEIELEKRLMIGELQLSKSESTKTFEKAKERAVYGEKPPYFEEETRKNIETITIEELANAKRKYFGARNLYIAIVGPNNKPNVLRWADETVGKLPRTGNKKHRFRYRHIRQQRYHLEANGNHDYKVLIACPVVGYSHRERFPLELIEFFLTGGEEGEHQDSSRLFSELVYKKGIVYCVTTNYSPLQGIGMWDITAEGILRENLGRVKNTILRQLAILAMKDIDDISFNSAKEGLIASIGNNHTDQLSFAEDIALAGLYSDHAIIYEEHIKRIKELTPQDIRRAATRYFGEKRFFIGTLIPNKQH